MKKKLTNLIVGTLLLKNYNATEENIYFSTVPYFDHVVACYCDWLYRMECAPPSALEHSAGPC